MKVYLDSLFGDAHHSDGALSGVDHDPGLAAEVALPLLSPKPPKRPFLDAPPAILPKAPLLVVEGSLVAALAIANGSADAAYFATAEVPGFRCFVKRGAFVRCLAGDESLPVMKFGLRVMGMQFALLTER